MGGMGNAGAGNPGAPPPSGDPGRVAIRRLNRIEYNNTVRDLLGSKLQPADTFAPDPFGLGFDNNGDVQTLSTVQIEQYQTAAEALVDEVLVGGVARVATLGRVAACNLASEGTPCIEKLLTGLARRAWRRPVATDEVARLTALANAAKARGEDASAQLRIALVALLSSPHFLFRAEPDPTPQATASRLLTDHEIATRLSYLLYASLPDDVLFDAADKGQLTTESAVRAQAMRMLTDAKGKAFVERFAAQWLDLQELDQHDVDPALFGKVFDQPLAQAMKAETLALFSEFLAADLPVADLLTARFTFVNARLAQHYGLPATGPTLSRVALTGEQRRGLLGHASVLTTTSSPNGTNPVARGYWVLTHLLCAPPPPPPPDIPPLPEMAANGTTVRARFEAHRTNPACAACHVLMDPIGFALENYDAIGRWRTTDNGAPVDARGMLPDGSTFNGPVQLADVLRKDPSVASCLAANLFTYATGRAPRATTSDNASLERIVAIAGGSATMTLEASLLALVSSDAFRMQQREPVAGNQGVRP
jgi:hypothetical protein